MAGRRALVTIGGLLSLTYGCHRRPPSVAAASTRICAPRAAVPAPGTIRLDGWWGPRADDSLVVVVDGRERWRGLYVLCTDARAATAPSHWPPIPADSVRSVYTIHGDTVRRTFHIGGVRPSALIIETTRP